MRRRETSRDLFSKVVVVINPNLLFQLAQLVTAGSIIGVRPPIKPALYMATMSLEQMSKLQLDRLNPRCKSP